jgi:class 3 adenylate cyclase
VQDGLRQRLLAGWEQLPPETRRHAVGWSAFIAGLILLGLWVPWLSAGIWTSLNMVQVGLALGRSLLRPHALIRAWPVLARWSIALSLVGSLLVRTFIEPLLSQWIERTIPPNLLFLAVMVLVFPFVLLGTTLVGVCGGALGAQLASESKRRIELARLGVRGVWLTLAGLLLVGFVWELAFGLTLPVFLSIVLSFPWVMLRTGHLMSHDSDQASAEYFDRILKQALVWRLPARWGSAPLDLRATALSLVAFGVAASLNALAILGPLQATALTGLIQIQNAFHHLPAALFTGVRPSPLGFSRRIVLVDWDSDTMRQVHTESSEPRVQADVIERLSHWKALRIVLPPPTLDAVNLPDSQVVADVGPDDAERARTDLPRLIESVRNSRRVLFQTTEGRARRIFDEVLRGLERGSGPGRPEFDDAVESVAGDPLRELRTAALESASGWLASLRVAALPLITANSRTNPPGSIPWQLYQAVTGDTNPPATTADRRSLQLANRNLPLAHPNGVLVDLQRATPGHDFSRVTYSSILRNEPVFTGTGTGPKAWQSAPTFFEDKIVFLHPVVPSPHATALGEMSRTELLAYATQTLLDGKPFARVSTPWANTCALLVALAVGLASARSNPIHGSWRLLVALTAIGGLTLWRALDDVWIDPVLPGSAALLAFLGVTQLTSTLDRLARDRNRSMLQRFVAPEVVADMMDRQDGRAELGGQREEVAVLFADVRGFTQFAEAHPPEEVMRVVNAYLAALTDALNAHGGLLDKYTGDGLMALFRLGDRGPDALPSAVHAALAMRDAVLRLSEDRTRGGDNSLKVGISLHVGDAVLGLVGNPRRQINFTALGHTVVVAARLQAVAGGGEVVITGELADRIRDHFDLEERAPLQAKGISQPLRVFRVLNPVPVV